MHLNLCEIYASTWAIFLIENVGKSFQFRIEIKRMAASFGHAAKVISGTAVAKSIRQKLRQEVLQVRKERLMPTFAPKLVVVQVRITSY